MADVEFNDYSMRVNEAIENAAVAFLHEAAGELEGQVKRGTPVDTGQLKDSWKHTINESKLEAQIGSELENAIWNEFGTGQYALHGDGRKTPWKYQDQKGKWHKTTGKKPQRTLFFAFEKAKPKIKKLAEQKFKGIK